MWKRAGNAVWMITLGGLLGFLAIVVLLAFVPVGFPIVVAVVAAGAVWMFVEVYFSAKLTRQTS